MPTETNDFHIVHEALVQYYGRLVPSIGNYELLVLHAQVHRASCVEVRGILQGENWRTWYKGLPEILLHAATHDYFKRVSDLFRIGVRPGILGIGTPLFNFLCDRQKVDMARLFVAEGRALDDISLDQKLELLHGNVIFNRIQTVDFLVRECNINVSDAGASGDNALVIAVQHKHIDMLELLLTHSERIDMLCGGQTLLHLCLRTRASHDMIRMLLQHGANPEILDHQNVSPLHLAVQYNSLDMVNALLDGGADINRVNDTGNTALHVAVNHGFIAISRLLQIRGADVDVVNAQGQTARTIAIKWNLVPILEFL